MLRVFLCGVCLVFLSQNSFAQVLGTINKVNTPITIDGVADDAAWAGQPTHDTSEFYSIENGGDPFMLEATPNWTGSWRAAWDDTNLYVLVEVNDDVIINSQPDFGGFDSGNWEDDSVEFYIDSGDVNAENFNPNDVPDVPAYQFTSLAGWTPALADAERVILGRDPDSLPNTSFTYGINSFDGNNDFTTFDQTTGESTSSAVTAAGDGGFNWTFEASFPWASLNEESGPDAILARQDADPENGGFGFGLAYNDDDDFGGRDAQYMWGTMANDLWNRSVQTPTVQLADGPTAEKGDMNGDGAVNFGDLTPFSLGLTDIPAYEAAFPELADSRVFRGDVDEDTFFNFGDLTPFVNLLTGGSASGSGAVPEPSALALLAIGACLVGYLRRR